MIAGRIALAVLGAAGLPVALAAQQPDFTWEKALAAGSTVRLHNLNGDVIVSQASGDKVEVTGIKRGDRRYFDRVTLDVVETSRGIVVCPDFRDVDMECSEDGFRVHGRDSWRDDDIDVSIDIVVKLPRGLVVAANSVSGDVSVTSAEGTVRGGSVSGDVRMERLRASAIRAASVSGNVDVSVAALTGDGDLEFTSVSGDVTVTLPANIDANVSMRSVSGSLDSDFPLTLSSGRMGRHSIEARIGRGGRSLEVRTVSGDVRLRSAK